MNSTILKRMMFGALLALSLQCQIAHAACDPPGRSADRAAERCLPA